MPPPGDRQAGIAQLGYRVRATEIGFAIHESHAADGAAVTLPVAHRSRRIDPFPWGND